MGEGSKKATTYILDLCVDLLKVSDKGIKVAAESLITTKHAATTDNRSDKLMALIDSAHVTFKQNLFDHIT